LKASFPIVALAGWIVPGGGYFLLGERVRGIIVLSCILLMFMSGLLIGGVRVIDVPGFDDMGQKTMVQASGADRRTGVWSLRARPLAEIVNKPWFVGQVLAGPVALGAAKVSVEVSAPATPGTRISAVPKSHARLFDIGTLYTAVAGMLNLITIIDSAARAGASRHPASRGVQP
jgi:hypothetical protein